jgi:hypothetical protein
VYRVFCSQVILLVDEELGALPWEALPLIKQHCACVSRSTSLYHLRAGMQVRQSLSVEVCVRVSERICRAWQAPPDGRLHLYS